MVMRTLRALLGALTLAAGLFVVPASTPSSVAGLGAVPACRIDDILTVPRDYGSWSVTLVDWLLRVGKGYTPPDLVPVSDAGVPGGGRIREVAIDDLRALARAADANGTPIASLSAYRSYKQQRRLFNGYANDYGYDDAVLYSMRPGHSEHQLGLAIDFMAAGGGNPMEGDWATTPTGRWMLENGWKFGWLMSYPPGKPNRPWSKKVCFRYEPWHYRYVGRDLARKIHRSGLTVREYLWAHFTLVDPTTGEPFSTATAAPAVPASPSPSPEASPTPPPSPSAPPAAATAPASPAAATEVPTGRSFEVDPLLGAGFLLVLTSIGLVVLRERRRRSTGV